MTWKISSAVIVMLGFGVSAGAQMPSGPLAGSVPGGPATSAPIALTLADAVDRGLRYNLALVSLEQQAGSAEGARIRSLRELMPRAEARAGETRQTTNLAAFGFDASLFPGLPNVIGPYNLFDARVYGSQTIVDLGALNDVRSKTAALSAVRLDAQNTRDLVTFVVTSLYFQAEAGERRIDTARSHVSTAESLLALANNLRNAGATPGIDVVRAQVQLQTQRQRLIAAENDFAKNTLQLVRAIGLPTAQRIQLTDHTLAAASTLTLDEALTRATASRADYQAAVGRVHAAETALKAAHDSALPTVRVSADYGAIGSSPGDARRTYSMAASVRVPLFDSDRQGKQMEDAATLHQRQADATDLAQRIEAEVRTALLDVQATEQQLAVARERSALSAQELSLAQVRFSAGVTSNLEVIQAQNEVAASAENEIASVYAFNMAQAALTRSVGTSGTTRR
jgi:outer membrane protein TolC